MATTMCNFIEVCLAKLSIAQARYPSWQLCSFCAGTAVDMASFNRSGAIPLMATAVICVVIRGQLKGFVWGVAEYMSRICHSLVAVNGQKDSFIVSFESRDYDQ